MKIGIVGFCNLYAIPYMNMYTDPIKKSKHDFEVIYWNRKNIEEVVDYPVHIYNEEIDDAQPKYLKFLQMYKFSSYVTKIIKKNKYDFLIILTTIPSVLLRNTLKQYKKKYIVDIRDYSYEHIFLYRKMLKGVLENSTLNVVSSPDFIDYLPYKNAYVCHNISFDDSIINREKHEKVIIGFVGGVRYSDECIKFIQKIQNDDRFEFRFYGSGVGEIKIKSYCLMNNIENVLFFGAYLPEEKKGKYESIDIVYNAYGNDSKHVKLALSNKLYDAAWYGLPIIVNKYTAMAKYSEGISFEIDDDDFLSDNLWNWYKNIDPKEFQKKAHEIIQKSLNENTLLSNKLKELFPIESKYGK